MKTMTFYPSRHRLQEPCAHAMCLLTLFTSLLHCRASEEEHDNANYNEETKVDLHYYIEYQATAPGLAKLDELLICNVHGAKQLVTAQVPFISGTASSAGSWLTSRIIRADVLMTDKIISTESELIGATPEQFPPDPTSESKGDYYGLDALMVNKIYHTGALKATNVAAYKIHYLVPDGLELYSRPWGSNQAFRPGSILQVTVTGNDPAFEIVILPKSHPGALPGKVMGVEPGNGELRLSLGFLANGKSAGFLDFYHPSEFTPLVGDWVLRVTPSAGRALGNQDIRAVSLGDEVEIITQTMPAYISVGVFSGLNILEEKGIRQIIAPQAIVDIQKTDGVLYIRFYHPNQKLQRILSEQDQYPLWNSSPGIITYPAGKGPYAFQGDPFVSYKISFNAESSMDFSSLGAFTSVLSSCNTRITHALTIVRDEGQSQQTATVEHHDLYCYVWNGPDEGYIVFGFGGTPRITEVSGFSTKYKSVSEPFRASVGLWGASGTTGLTPDTLIMMQSEASASERYYKGGFPTVNKAYRIRGFVSGNNYIVNNFSDRSYGKKMLWEITDGDQKVKTMFDYHVNEEKSAPKYDTHHGRMKSRRDGDGGWAMFDYSTDLASVGRVTKTIRPWLSTSMPGDIPTTTSGYHITNTSYTFDWDGSKRVPLEQATVTNGYQTGRTTHAYASSSANGQPVWSATTSYYPSSSGMPLVTINRIYQGHNVDSWLQGLPYSSQSPDGSQESVAYHKGIVNATTGVFTSSTGGSGFRSVVFKGTSRNDAGGTQISSYEGTQIDPLYMIPNVSTAEVTIRNEYAHTVRTETLLYTSGSAWKRIDFANMRYDIAGNLVYREKLNGTIYEAEYTTSSDFTNTGAHTGRKQRERDEQGVTNIYTYDDNGRVATSTRLAMGGLAEIQISFTYDDENRILSTTIGSGTASIVTSKTYDRSGRVTSETNQGLVADYVYSVANGILSATTGTLPGGATRIIKDHYDGRPESITGSSSPEEHYAYTSGSNGFLSTTKYIGSSGVNSPRWVKITTDWLGRTVAQTWPAANNSVGTVTQTTDYNARGQIAMTQTGSLAPALYFYDANGVMNEHGLSLSRSSTLGNNDRKHAFNYGYVEQDNAIWNCSETYAYPDGSTTGVAQTKTWTRMTGFSAISPPAGVTGNLIAESIAEDANGNKSKKQTFLDRLTGAVATVIYIPHAANPAITTAIAGLVVKQVSAAGVTTSYVYDSLDRPVKTIDRTSGSYAGNNITYHPSTTRIHTIIDNCGVVQHTYAYDNAGRLIEEKTPRVSPWNVNVTGANTTNYIYDIRGRLTHVYGDVPYPVRYEYDDYNQRTAQYTFRISDNNATADGDKTAFAYHDATGVMLSRTHIRTTPGEPDQTVSYTYTDLGQLTTRTWARGLATTYTYDDGTGLLVSGSYSDGTPALSYTHDRLGRIKTVTDATGTRTFAYRDTTDLKPATETLGAFYDGLILANQYAPVTARHIGLKIQHQNTEEYSVSYAYSPADSRLATIANSSGTYAYAYLANSNLISSVTSAASVVTRAYELNRNLLASIAISTSASNTDCVAGYGYLNDALGRRIMVTQIGRLYAPYMAAGQVMRTYYTYNNRNELTAAQTIVDNTMLAGRNFGYAFDPIGNRVTESIDGTQLGYTTNELNQYTERKTPLTIPASGIAGAGAIVSVGGTQLAHGDWLNGYFHKNIPKITTTGTVGGLQSVNFLAVNGSVVHESAASVHVRPASELFCHDLDGNFTDDSLWKYAYDGENRLKWIRCLIPDENGNKVSVEFTYDYMGRRASKDIYHYTGNSPETPATRVFVTRTIFLYQGWTLLCEYTADSPSPSILNLSRRFTWGPDLSGTMGGAGDIGGLLAIEDLRPGWQGTFHPAFDGNGNLMALIEASTGNMVAAYEYDPFGNMLRSSGAYAKESPFRFSGKYYDTETGLSYFGFRYYSASLGRFINRDPLEERGGWNLYSGLKRGAADPYAGASGVEGTSWQTEWEQAQDRLLSNTSLPHTTQSVSFGGKRNSGLPGSSDDNQKTYTANSTGHYPQGGAPGTGALAPSISVGNPAAGNADVNLYIFVGNNPINHIDPLGLVDVNLVNPMDLSLFITMNLIPAGQAGRTTVGFHGVPGGAGFGRNSDGSQPLDRSDINASVTGNSHHTAGNEIVMYVCHGGVGENLTTLQAIARRQNSPVVAATNEVEVSRDLNFRTGAMTYTGVTVLNGGRWIVIEPNGTVRDRGTPENATTAETQSRQARVKADQTMGDANNAATRARETADAAASAKQAASQRGATKVDKQNASNARSEARAAQRASEAANEQAAKDEAAAAEAQRQAEVLRREANRPL